MNIRIWPLAAVLAACFLLCPAFGLGMSLPQDLTVQNGTVFEVTLKSNPTTGYSWKVLKISDKRIVRTVSSKYEADRPVLSGSGGQEIWSFKALRPGRAKIEMSYQRPWEKGVPPAMAKTFNIRVR